MSDLTRRGVVSDDFVYGDEGAFRPNSEPARPEPAADADVPS